MPSAENLTPESRFVGLFIGPSGSGKTVASCSFPHPILVWDFDDRISGIDGAAWINRKGIEYKRFPPRLRGSDSNFTRLNDECEGLLAAASVGQCPYKTLVLDSLTSLTFAFLCDAVPLTHIGGKGKKLGTLNMPGPEDYGFEANGTYQVLAFLRSIPIPNIIVSAHVIDRYGRLDPSDNYSERVVVGEKISLRDKISENSQIYFNHIFRFDKQMAGDQERFFVQFRSDLARTTYKELPNGKTEVTGKDFYQYLMDKVRIKEAIAV